MTRSCSLHALLAAACLLAFGSLQAAEPDAKSLAIVNARIFDGSRVILRGTVVIEGGRIAAVGPEAKPPAGAAVVDASGATLLPGLLDGHTHTWGDALARALQFGVTTELDMFTDPRFAQAMRQDQEKTGAPERADLKSAGFLATAPGGHGTQFGVPVPPLTKPEEALSWVDARIAEGSDYIKIIWEDGSVVGRTIPSLDRAIVAAVIRAAHQRGKLAVVHASTQATARAAIEEGADGLVHIFADQAPEPGFAALAAERKVFVVPTLTVLEGATGGPGGGALAEDPRLAPYLRSDEVTNLKSGVKRPDSKRQLAFALEAVRQLHAAGVPIVAGSDAPNRGTAHGPSVHREMEMLVQAGLSPTEALAAATSVAAKSFRLDDRGRIAPGLRADLILVQGDPTTDILATRNLLRVWKSGHEIERRKIAEAAPPPRPEIPASGLVSDFEGDSPSASFGHGWVVSTDSVVGGKSTAETRTLAGGAPAGGSPGKSLLVSGEIRPGATFPWAGVTFTPGPALMAPADLSAVKEIAFWAKGDGGTHELLLFTVNRSRQPASRTFVAGPEWQRYVFPLSSFEGVDPRGVIGLFWGGGVSQGPFQFQIDDVTFGR
jgi:imidazolonepropionase-like amidohydrolase